MNSFKILLCIRHSFVTSLIFIEIGQLYFEIHLLKTITIATLKMQVKVWLPKEKGKFNTEDDSNIKTYWRSSLTTIEKISCMKQFDSNITRLKKMV